MRAALFAALLASCGGPSKPAAPPPAPPSRCPRVAEHVVSLMKTDGAPTEVIDKVTNVLIARCDGDGWSPAAQECFLGMTALEQGERCQTQLTKAQLDAANAAMDDALGKKKE